MSNASRQAQRDAEEYAKAYLAYGEGAGTRRKLINSTIEYKMGTVPGYRDSFYKAAEQQDMAKLAKEAKKHDRRRSVNTAITRNTKAVMSGKYENVNTLLLAAGAGVYFAHRYGYDKKLVEVTKQKYHDIKSRFGKSKKDRVHNISSV